MIERSEIQFGLTRIAFSIRRSARRKTVALTIEPPGRLVLTAPPNASVEALDDVVRRKARWILARVKQASDRPPPLPEPELSTGETVRYLGRQYRLRVVDLVDGEKGFLRGGWLHAPVTRGLDEEARRRAVRRVVVSWLKAHAEGYLPERLAGVCARAGVPLPALLVRGQHRRWGSCDARGTLRINWRIIQAPPSLIDYVLAHEIVHLRCPTHGPAFWAALGRIMPDYEARRAALRRCGASYVW